MVKIMENPMNKWMIWGENHLFLDTPIYRVTLICLETLIVFYVFDPPMRDSLPFFNSPPFGDYFCSNHPGWAPQIIHFNWVLFPLFSPSILGVFPLFVETSKSEYRVALGFTGKFLMKLGREKKT